MSTKFTKALKKAKYHTNDPPNDSLNQKNFGFHPDVVISTEQTMQNLLRMSLK